MARPSSGVAHRRGEQLHRVAHFGHLGEHHRRSGAHQQIGAEADRRVGRDAREGVGAATLHTDDEIRGRARLASPLVQHRQPPLGHREDRRHHRLEAVEAFVLQPDDGLVPTSLAFCRDRLGFDVTFQGPAPDDVFFGIVRRGGAQILLKAVGVEPQPNRTRDVNRGVARWDACLHVPDPDALAAEFAPRWLTFLEPLSDTDDGLRGFAVAHADGYVLFFGRPR